MFIYMFNGILKQITQLQVVRSIRIILTRHRQQQLHRFPSTCHCMPMHYAKFSFLFVRQKKIDWENSLRSFSSFTHVYALCARHASGSTTLVNVRTVCNCVRYPHDQGTAEQKNLTLNSYLGRNRFDVRTHAPSCEPKTNAQVMLPPKINIYVPTVLHWCVCVCVRVCRSSS